MVGSILGMGTGYPNFGYYSTRQNRYINFNNSQNSYVSKKEENNDESKKRTVKEKYQEQKDRNNTKKMNNDSYNENPIFQIFGINLYYDDILLICLIFFLYQEGVKDESLFISLILLLLS